MIELKTPEAIESIRRAGAIAAKAFRAAQKIAAPGMTTAGIDSLIKAIILENGGSCAFLGYRSFPAATCISVNEEVVHGIPSENRILEDGDIVSIDIGVDFDGYIADSAVTYPVGKIGARLRNLIRVARKALQEGIKQAYAGNFLSNISHNIQRYVETNGFSVVRDFAGHGVGRAIHEEPQIPNFGKPNCGIKLKEGMVLAIEPMVNMGSWEVEVMPDGWTVRTKDKLPSAHFEHTVVVLNSGPEILTCL
ncbi:MAG: type I methionyl aminopeptidase [Candidatus Omnitrophica bacterium CG11_big_fil_rev_8_21_14_0_20_42_13]|uniref:Methionine aminopeptidase n=1 Tax=Candidatus Ghiorseimicrobium undicola TaxID=1974746 RepID=A0A2H0LVD8_9BACT|nr:MAG: type I methionyl aminopeptidase [Candidatus Omnitrophica bacterium CG11_big_fil_rev_8_21_14_0_20_42_13]